MPTIPRKLFASTIDQHGQDELRHRFTSWAAAAVTLAAAQGLYIQGPGFGVGIGRPAYRDRYYYRGYRDYGGAYAYSGKRYYRGPGDYPRRSYRWRDPDWD